MRNEVDTERPETDEIKAISPSSLVGGFQLEFVNISRVINHMTCYNSSALIG